MDEQGINLEESVWVSVRMLEERRNLLSLLATDAENAGNLKLAIENQIRADEMGSHAEKMKIILSKLTIKGEELPK
jgi:two-component system chemotaxis response regulator CheB